MKKIRVRFGVLLLMILLAAFSRLVYPFNMISSLGAMALFGGAYFSERWKAYGLPMLSLLLSDMVIQGVILEGKYGFPLYDGWYWVYGTFAFMVLLGQWMIKQVSVASIVKASILASLVHWLITDFFVWYSEMNVQLYTKDFSGFILCYYMAIPFLLKFLVGTLFYSSLLFGIFEWMQRRYFSLATFPLRS